MSIDLEDAQLAEIAERARERTEPAPTSTIPPASDAFRRALDRMGESVRRGKSTWGASSPSTPPSSEQGARGRALLQKARETIPPRFRWARFDAASLTTRVAARGADVDRARAYAADPPHSLLLVGSTGAGKTSLACAILNEIVDVGLAAHQRRIGGASEGELAPFAPGDLERFRRAVHCRFVAAYELARAHSEAQLGEEPRKVRRARTASVLVLDDLGMDTTYKRSSCVRDLLHERDAHGRPTIITTYLTSNDIAVHYGAGIRRRLADGAVMNLARSKLT